MEQGQNQNTMRSTGAGDQWNYTPTRVPRSQATNSPQSVEEFEFESPLGESQRQQIPSNPILPETREFVGGEMVAVRRLIRVLQRRAAILAEDSLREEFLSEEWWRCVNEVEIVQDTIQAIRRAFRRN